MKEKVLFVILDHYADWEYAFLAASLQDRIQDKTSPYEVKTISLTRNPVKSIGGFATLPDYAIDEIPDDYAAVILIGGTSWRTDEAKRVVPLVKRAMTEQKIVGAICDATVFLGMNSFLNEKRHTSNTLDDLSAAAQDLYSGHENYVCEQAVRDGNLVTANGSAYLEFMREVLFALKAYPDDYVESNYQFYKLGYLEFLKTLSE